MGVNAAGIRIFKDADAAYEQALIDFAEGFKYLYEHTDLPPVSKKASVMYKYAVKGWQNPPPMTIKNYESIGEQCREISSFAYIYVDSFGDY